MPKKILLISLPGMGDTLMFTPVIECLHRYLPEADLTALVMYHSGQQVLQGSPHLRRVILWDFMGQGFWKSLKFMRSLRQERYDASIIYYPSNRLAYNVVSFLAGARIRLGHQYRHQNWYHLPWLNTHTLKETEGMHNVDENLRLLQFLGMDPGGCAREPRIYLSEPEEKTAQHYWDSHRLGDIKCVIGMHTWSTELKNMHEKCWSNDKFAALIDTLKKDNQTEVLLLEGPHDQAANERILQQVKYKPLRVQNLSVKATAALLKKCSLLVTNDSGVMHLAAAVKTPVVAIFGPTNPDHTGPFYTPHQVVRQELPCSPCFFYSTRPLTCRAKQDYQCLDTVTVAQVKAAIDAQLEGEPA